MAAPTPRAKEKSLIHLPVCDVSTCLPCTQPNGVYERLANVLATLPESAPPLAIDVINILAFKCMFLFLSLTWRENHTPHELR